MRRAAEIRAMRQAGPSCRLLHFEEISYKWTCMAGAPLRGMTHTVGPAQAPGRKSIGGFPSRGPAHEPATRTMPRNVAIHRFQRDLRAEHLSSTTAQADAVAVLFSWTDQVGRGYEIVQQAPDQLVARVAFDEAEREAAIGDLDAQCSALGLVREELAGPSGPSGMAGLPG